MYDNQIYHQFSSFQEQDLMTYWCLVHNLEAWGWWVVLKAAAFYDKDYMSETERENIVAKLPRPISSGETARTTTLKYGSVNLLRKEVCR
jgi:hypothetical protein